MPWLLKRGESKKSISHCNFRSENGHKSLTRSKYFFVFISLHYIAPLYLSSHDMHAANASEFHLKLICQTLCFHSLQVIN